MQVILNLRNACRTRQTSVFEGMHTKLCGRRTVKVTIEETAGKKRKFNKVMRRIYKV